jgi:NAD(P)-dependent dehydrogenase (short-subunit alcohol dehydrogenase family)
MPAEFADRVAFVTGAGSGIGAAVAVRLASKAPGSRWRTSTTLAPTVRST